MNELPPDLRSEIEAALASADPARAPLIPGEVYGRRLAARRSARRAAGAYYTPPHLVDLVVERTLGPLLDAAPDAYAALRVVDPACGAGIFLVGAARAVARRHGPVAARAFAARCLVGVDLDPIAAALCRLAVRLATGAEPAVAIGDAVGGPFPVPGRFDAVIGNPPWGQKGFTWPEPARRYVREHFATGRGVIDPYAVFVERATELVRPGGRWGFVLPDVLLLKNQQDARDVILERCTLEWLVHAGRAFPGVNLDAVVVVARRDLAADAHRVSIWHTLPPEWRSAPPPTHAIEQATFTALPGHKLNLWITPPALALWRRLDRFPRLAERFEAHEGVHTGNARAKLFVPEPRGDHCVPIIVGRAEVARFQLSWAGTWLDRDPAVLDRAAGEYASLGRPAWHERPKIVVRRTGDRIVAAYDARGLWCSNNLFVVLPREPVSAEEQRAYVALLNSRLMTWLFRTVQPRTGRLFAELKLHHLLAFPVPELGRWRRAVPALARLGPRADPAVERMFDLSPAEIAIVAGAW